MNKNLLRYCLAEALTSLPNHPQRKHYVHISFAIVRNRVLSVGFNKSASPPIHFGYANRVPNPKTHSELDAYMKLRKRVSIGKTDWELVNVRINRSGEMKLSMPCWVCQEWLAAVGCKSVTWTTEDGWKSVTLNH